MNNPRDFEIARLLGWYRIPLRSSPKVIAVDYLAFYQTSAFGERQARIEYIAPVKGYELTTRAELLRDEANHPHAHQEYYKIQLGSLIALTKPIVADRWKRITFFYTTGEHFASASTINDLIVAQDDRPILWQALRERQQSRENYQLEGDVQLTPEILAELLGFKALVRQESEGSE